MKKTIALLLALMMVCGLFTGCSNTTSNNSTPPAGNSEPAQTDNSGGDSDGRRDEITVALSVDLADLTPCQPNGPGRSNIFWTIYETLFDYDENMNFTGNLAKGYTEVSDTEWDVELYQEIYDSDGNHITADDVVFCVNWLVDNGYNIRYNLFDSIEKIDEYTVRYHWTEKPASLSDLEWPLCRTFIFSETAWNEHNFASEPVATGNFKVENYTIGSSLVLVANEDYWADKTSEDVSGRMPYHNTNVSRTVFNVIPESTSAVLSLQTGEIDFCDYVPVANLADFQEGGAYSDKYIVETTISTDYYYLMPNATSSVLGDDVNLRLAIYYALDNNAIAAVMGGDYMPLQTLGSTAFPDFNESWNDEANYVNTQDADKAKEYLAQSSYSGETITIVGVSDEAAQNAMRVIVNELQAVGITAEMVPYEKAMFQTIVAEREGWDFSLTSVGGATLIGSFSTLFSQIENNGYSSGWVKDDTLEELFQTANADATHDDEHMKELIDYAFENGYVYPLTALSSSLVYTKDISKVVTREGYWVIGACEFAQ